MQDETGTITDGGTGSIVANAAGPSGGRMERRQSRTSTRIIGTGVGNIVHPIDDKSAVKISARKAKVYQIN
jgi:hypothetical protein